METKERARANAPGLSRRRLLTAAPAFALAGAASAQDVGAKFAATSVAAETPVMALFRDWKAAQEMEDAAYAASQPDEVTNHLGEIRFGIEKRMMAEPCQGPQDFICKVIAHTAFGVFALPDENERPALWAEARALIGA